MSGERAPLPPGGNSLLRGSRTRSYGSLIRSPLSPVRRRHIEHQIQPGETLQGLALKYGVSMEQIKRANRLYTNDSIFLKKSLSIPVLPDLDHDRNGVDSLEEDSEGCGSSVNSFLGSSSDMKQDDHGFEASDLTPNDFFKRLDNLISQSKQAAAQRYQEAEGRVADLEAACTSRTSTWRPLTRSQSVLSPPGLQQQAAHVAVPITITKLTQKLREREDEIFQL